VDKCASVEQLVETIPDGATIALGGLSMNSAPMAYVREIVRQEKRDLTVVAIVAGMSVDWLIAGGCVKKIVSGLVSFEGLGLAPMFRMGVQSGRVEIEEYSEDLLICRLRAQAWNLPFVPTKAGLGTDLLPLHEGTGTIRVEVDGATGEHYVACTRLPVDVALVHAHSADELGNVRVDPKLIWMDNEIVNAAERTFVSVERYVDHADVVAEPHRTTYPQFMVSGVALAEIGAYPTSCFPEYSHHTSFFKAYSAAASVPEEFETFFADRVLGPKTWDDFIKSSGGDEMIAEIRRRSA
jgi:glutaconate CoA-transferase subunit A